MLKEPITNVKPIGYGLVKSITDQCPISNRLLKSVIDRCRIAVQELFQELEEYILSDDDHRKRVAERNEARQGNRDTTWRAPPQHPRNVNSVGNSQPQQDNRPSTRGGFNPRGRGEEEEPQDSRTTTQKILTSTASIMEEATAPKGAQKQRGTWQESNKRKH
jgi:hypothetical protein